MLLVHWNRVALSALSPCHFEGGSWWEGAGCLVLAGPWRSQAKWCPFMGL